MRETELRIQKYKAMLPRARERVIAALMVFMLAIAMMAVSTFSWITLSVAPEVSGVTTTIAANGNLEIALAGRYDSAGNLLEPAPTAIGDGALSVTERNLTWGNLVNLSDSSYALERIVLRPAALNKHTLLTAPLYAAKYSVYGQVVDYDEDFALTAWDGSGFEQSNKRGVNAISSVLYETIDYEDPNAEAYKNLAANAKLYLRNADSEWESMDSKMDPIGGLIETFMSGQLKESADNPNALENEVCDPDDVLAFYELMVYMYETPLESLGDALIEILYMYQLNTSSLKVKTDTTEVSVYPNPVKFTSVDDFCEGALDELSKISAARAMVTEKADDFVTNITTELFNSSKINDAIFKTVKQYIKHRETLAGYIADFEEEGGIKSKAEKAKMGDGTVVWSDISGIVQGLVNINTCEIGGYTVPTLSTGSGMKAAVGMLSGTQEAVIKDGLLVDMEGMLHDGDGIRVTNLEVRISKDALKAKLESSGYGSLSLAVDAVNLGKDYVSVTANVTTYATAKYPTATAYLDIEKANVIVGTPLKSSKYYAQDTYGLSVDFWLRTNAPSTYLILEGEVMYDNNPITAVVNIANENGDSTSETVEVYLATVKRTVVTVTGTGESAKTDTKENYFTEQEIYNKNNVWYYVSNSQPVVITDKAETYTDEETGITTTVTTNAVIEGTPEQKLSKNVIGYSGVNRIWNDETYLGSTYNTDYSTSQGTGSCYTFYVDDPSDTDKYLDLLSALRVVFHDAEGNYLATAVLDKTLAYSEYGKVIVPLVIMEENSTVYATIESDDSTNTSVTVPTITTLYKGDAELITALVYLDGELVDNTQVLDSSEIQGKLNIQFGSTYVPNEALKDDSLRDEEIHVTGEIEGDKEANYDPENPHTVKVKVTIDGDTPKIVTGNFVRVLNNVQGTLYKSVTFAKTAEEGVWEATVSFNAPGTFIMRSVFIDGIEYEIERTNTDDSVKVTITGFALTSFSSADGYGSSATFITADSSVSERFLLKLASDEYRPSSVKGVFVNENNVYVTVTFDSNISDITEWTGTANFIYPGTYKMTNIVIDGNYYALPNNVTYTRTVSTGLRANVNVRIADTYTTDESLALTNGNIAYLFRGYSHEFSVTASIVDGSGKALGYVGDKIQVNYTGNLNTDLYWDGEKYVGDFLVENPGEFKFSNIYLNTYAQYITSASEAHSITCIPTDPVEYLGIVNTIPEEVITVGGNEANGNIITMRFKNAQASTLYGLFEVTDGDGNKNYTVLAANRTIYGAESDNTNDFTFNITQDGYWKLIDTKLSLVYDSSTTPGKFYLGDGMLSVDENNNLVLKANSDDGVVDVVNTIGAGEYDSSKVLAAFTAADKYYEFDENAGTDTTLAGNTLRADGTKVIAEFNVKTTVDGSEFKSNVTDTGVFMQTHTHTLGLTVTDFTGASILESATWTVTRKGGTSKTYGEYTYDDDDQNAVINSNNDISNGTLNVSLTIAGEHASNITYTAKGVTQTILNTELPSIIVSSTAPSVKIDSVSPNTSMGVDTSSDGSGYTTKTNSKTDTSATVYMQCTIHETGLSKTKRYCYQSSKVYITLSNSGYANNVNLAFGTGTPLYTTWEDPTGYGNYTSGGTNSYLWGENNTTSNGCDGKIGLYVGYSLYSSNPVFYRNGEKTPTGTLTATELVLTYNGVEYTVPVSITINNPY